MGGALYLLEDERFDKLVGALTQFVQIGADGVPDASRLVTQQELWAAFDHLYRDGSHPSAEGSMNRPRWFELLYRLAQAIDTLSIPQDRILEIQSGGSIVSDLFEPGRGGIVEISIFEDAPIHDQAALYRAYSRTLYTSPDNHFINIKEQGIKELIDFGWDPPPGAAAALIEQMIAVTPGGGLQATSIAQTIRSYRVSEEGNFEFSMYLASPTEGGLIYRHLRPDAEGWAKLDLPNIPRHVGVGLRVPWQSTCYECHVSAGLGINPFPRKRCASLISIREPEHDLPVVANRTVARKQTSPEWSALVYFIHLTPEAFSAELMRLEGPRPLLSSDLNGGAVETSQRFDGALAFAISGAFLLIWILLVGARYVFQDSSGSPRTIV